MSTSNYEGPRGGDYVRYVDALLRASPLYRSGASGLNDGTSRSDFTDAASTPGAQPASALARMRERAQEAVQQAQREVQREAQRGTQAGNSAGAARKGRRARLELESEQAARRAAQQQAAAKPRGLASWFRITPGRIVFVVILAILAMVLPGLGALVLLFTIINAVKSGIQSASKPS